MRVAADANVLLSAILGHAALKAIDVGKVELVTTLETLKEVEEHLPVLGERYGIDGKTLQANLLALDIRGIGPKKYRRAIAQARRRIGARDPEDVPLLALAIAVQVPVWSIDKVFAKSGVPTYTTAELLAKLGIVKNL